MISVETVYFIVDPCGYVKIGRTTGAPSTRLSELQVGNPRKLELAAWISESDDPPCGICDDMPPHLEGAWHLKFSRYRSRGEWFFMCQELESLIIELSAWRKASSKDAILSALDMNVIET